MKKIICLVIVYILIFYSKVYANRFYDDDFDSYGRSGGDDLVGFLSLIFLIVSGFWRLSIVYIVIFVLVLIIIKASVEFGSIGFLAVIACIYFTCRYIISKEEANSPDRTSGILIHTDKEKNKYYLVEYYSAARTWSFAHVKKVNGSIVEDLAYRFDCFRDIPYSVYYGTSSADACSRSKCIENGTINDNVVAHTIWNKYLEPIEKEKWQKINEAELKRKLK